MKKHISYPYCPYENAYQYVSKNNPYMYEAMLYAQHYSQYKEVPVGCVLVKDKLIIGYGANGSIYHEQYGCKRIALGIAHGKDYELCEGCSYKQHAEVKAIRDANEKHNNIMQADVYVWGHWWVVSHVGVH